MQQYPTLPGFVDKFISGYSESADRVAENIINILMTTLHEQENRPITVSQMKNIIMGSVSVPLFIEGAMRNDPSLIDRLITDSRATSMMRVIASDSPKEFRFDPKYNYLIFIEEQWRR